MQIILANPQGFCGGVAYAIKVVEHALKKYGAPLYIRHHIVHNTAVIKNFEKQGVIFVDDLEGIPDKANVIFSAHGVAPEVYEEAKRRNLHYIDATCPLVAKVHREAEKFSKDGIQTILIGHKKHQELIGTAGYVNPDLLNIIEKVEDIDNLKLDTNKLIGFLTQTTLSVLETKKIIERLKQKYPNIIDCKSICYATTNRQEAVMELKQYCDLIIICGSKTSSNTNRLRETAEKQGIETIMIDNADELDLAILQNKEKIGISSGASVPAYIVDEVVQKIQNHFSNVLVHKNKNKESEVVFKVPEV